MLIRVIDEISAASLSLEPMKDQSRSKNMTLKGAMSSCNVQHLLNQVLSSR